MFSKNLLLAAVRACYVIGTVGTAFAQWPAGIGQPKVLVTKAGSLRIETPISDELSGALLSKGLRLSSPEAYRRNGLEYPAVLRDADVTIELGASKKIMLVIKSKVPATEAFLDLMLEWVEPAGVETRLYSLVLGKLPSVALGQAQSNPLVSEKSIKKHPLAAIAKSQSAASVPTEVTRQVSKDKVVLVEQVEVLPGVVPVVPVAKVPAVSEPITPLKVEEPLPVQMRAAEGVKELEHVGEQTGLQFAEENKNVEDGTVLAPVSQITVEQLEIEPAVVEVVPTAAAPTVAELTAPSAVEEHLPRLLLAEKGAHAFSDGLLDFAGDQEVKYIQVIYQGGEKKFNQGDILELFLNGLPFEPRKMVLLTSTAAVVEFELRLGEFGIEGEKTLTAKIQTKDGVESDLSSELRFTLKALREQARESVRLPFSDEHTATDGIGIIELEDPLNENNKVRSCWFQCN